MKIEEIACCDMLGRTYDEDDMAFMWMFHSHRCHSNHLSRIGPRQPPSFTMHHGGKQELMQHSPLLSRIH
ncbi:hypothetical protein PISMIDRAFT_680711 [Pisolithus microcarpus 441]|uniref:Uncharacterized protein n=1 Tax=Pisolithus microcarpus 441 TaxID=765257 RepID=A0A0C9YB65_9AGAM|nr:hypothetical protein PISMIDRAFT_680711 [Pisolithus microcarpus 441]